MRDDVVDAAEFLSRFPQDEHRRWYRWPWRPEHRHPDTPPTLARRVGRWLGVAR